MTQYELLVVAVSCGDRYDGSFVSAVNKFTNSVRYKDVNI